jgi:hypothetical protein
LAVQRAYGALEDALQRPLGDPPAASSGEAPPGSTRRLITNNLQDHVQ